MYTALKKTRWIWRTGCPEFDIPFGLPNPTEDLSATRNFVLIRDVPASIVDHIARDQGFLQAPEGLVEYDDSGTRRRHVPIIRDYLRAKPFGNEGLALLGRVVREAAHTREDLADLINIGSEELLRQSFALPGFTTLLEEARRGRTEVNRVLCSGVYEALGVPGRAQIGVQHKVGGQA